MITLYINKTYKTKSGRLIIITKHNPNWNGGMFWGTSIDKRRPKIDHERWTPDGRWWDYIGSQILRDDDLDLIEEVI